MSVDAVQHCEDLVRRGDEDRWLAIGYADAPLQHRLFALHALHMELKRIPTLVSEPMIGEIRLQWFRDALEELRAGKPPRQHPVIEAIAATELFTSDYAGDIDSAIDAAARPLYGEPFASVETFIDWLAKSDGAIDAAASKIANSDSTFLTNVREASAVYTAARYGAILAPNLTEALHENLSARWEVVKGTFASTPASVMPAIGQLFLTPLYLKHRLKPFPVRKRLAIFRAVALGR